MMNKCKFNRELYMKLRGIREQYGLPVSHLGKVLYDHPLVGRKIKYLADNSILTIDKVVKNWYHGYYITIHPVDENRSHASLCWENISCVDTIILDGIEESHYQWELI